MLLDQGALEPERPGGSRVSMSGGLRPLGQPGEEVDDGEHDPALPVCEPDSAGEGVPLD